MDEDALYLDVESLRQRGWTEGLIKKFLGAPDDWEPVNHWANFQGKRMYWLGRVEDAENHPDFQRAYAASLKHGRSVSPEAQEAYLEERRLTAGDIEKWQKSLTPEQLRVHQALKEAGNIFKEARRRGYRTPHKC